ITPDYTFFLVDDFAEGSDRLVQIYQATRSVSDETYCITNSPVVDDDHAIRVPFEVKEPLLMPLYILPVFQIIAYEVSAKLNSWDNHPMFKDFKKYADSKTATVKKIMFD
ncbi:MAG: SIS domain-containing protein, partial [Erysipelotrichaceae bacterium]|nr:SIS domain-containing protein [Erysipelotrichaceae bacterium]